MPDTDLQTRIDAVLAGQEKADLRTRIDAVLEQQGHDAEAPFDPALEQPIQQQPAALTEAPQPIQSPERQRQNEAEARKDIAREHIESPSIPGLGSLSPDIAATEAAFIANWGSLISREAAGLAKAAPTSFGGRAATDLAASVAGAMFPAAATILGALTQVPPGTEEWFDKKADELNRAGDAYRAAAAERDEEGITPAFIKRGLRGVGESLPTSIIGGMAAGPYGAVLMAAGMEANQALTEGRDADLNGAELRNYVIRSAAIEALPAIIAQASGFGGFEKFFAKGGMEPIKAGLKESLKRAGIMLAEEEVEELITETGHYANSIYTGLGEFSWGGLSQTWGDTAFQTFLTMGAMESPRVIQGVLLKKQLKERANNEAQERLKEGKAPTQEQMEEIVREQRELTQAAGTQSDLAQVEDSIQKIGAPTVEQGKILDMPAEAQKNRRTRRQWYEQNRDRLKQETQDDRPVPTDQDSVKAARKVGRGRPAGRGDDVPAQRPDEAGPEAEGEGVEAREVPTAPTPPVEAPKAVLEMTEEEFSRVYARPSLKMKDGTILTAPRHHLEILPHQEKYGPEDVAESGWSYQGEFVSDQEMIAESPDKTYGHPEAYRVIQKRRQAKPEAPAPSEAPETPKAPETLPGVAQEATEAIQGIDTSTVTGEREAMRAVAKIARKHGLTPNELWRDVYHEREGAARDIESILKQRPRKSKGRKETAPDLTRFKDEAAVKEAYQGGELTTKQTIEALERVRSQQEAAQEPEAAPEAITVSNALYAKGQKLAKPLDSRQGFKGPSSRLAGFLKGKWTNRESGYVMSPRKAERLQWLLDHGYDSSIMGDKLRDSAGNDVADPTVKGKPETWQVPEAAPPVSPAATEAVAKEPWQMTAEELHPQPEVIAHLDAAIAKARQAVDRLDKQKPGKEAHAAIADNKAAWEALGNLEASRKEEQASWDDAQPRRERRHRESIVAALAAGKPVPPEVLADYPDLVSEAPKPQAKAPQKRRGRKGQEGAVPAKEAGTEDMAAAIAAELAKRQKPKRSVRAAENKEAARKRFMEAGRRFIDPTKAPLGLDASKVKDAVDMTLAAIDYGIASFDQLVSFAVESFGEQGVRTSAPYLEAAARQAGIKDVTSVEKVLGKQAKKATDTLIDDWLADRQDSEQDADSRAARHQDELRQIIGKRSVSETLGEALKGNPHQRERAMDAAMHMYIDLKDAEQQGFGTPAEQMAKYGDNLSDAQKNLFASSQSLPPAVQALADKIIKENKAQGEEALEAEVLKNVRDNYSARLWKQEPGKMQADAHGKFGTTTVRAKARALESILHGWSLGKELQITRAIAAQQIAAKQISQAIHDRRMIKAAVSEGLLSNKKEEGDWKIIEHPNFKNWQWIGKAEEGKVYGRGTFITEDGNILQEVPLYAPKYAATSLNNILGKSKLPGTGLITKWNAIFKQMLLSLSLFHHQAFLRSYVFGTHGIEGFRPLKAYREGKRAILNYEGMTRELVRAGLTIGTIQDFDERAIKEKTLIGKVIDRIPVAAELKNALLALRDQQIHFLFRKMGARLKVMGALHEFQRLLQRNKKKLESGKVTRKELARIAAEMLNDDFGGLNLQRMRRNPTGQHIFRLAALAPDWTESNVRSMVKMIKSGEEGAAYRQMWGRVFLRAGGMTVIWQLLMALMDDEEDFWSMYRRQWREGNLRWLDVDVTPLAKAAGFKIGRGQRKYFSVLGHFRDPVKFIAHPVKSAKHKSSVLGGFVLEALTGTDWAGRGFTTFSELLGIDDKGTYERSGKRSDGSTYEEGDPKGGQLAGQTVSWGNRGALEYSQMPSFLISQGKGTSPIQMQNLIGFLAGEMDGFDAVTKSVGLMTATTYPDKEMESEYGSYEWWKSGNAEERSEQFKSDLKRMSWRGEPLGYHEFLTPKQLGEFRKRHREKRALVIIQATHKPDRDKHKSDETYKESIETRDKNLEYLKAMRAEGVSLKEAQKLLKDYFEKDGGHVTPSYWHKRSALEELYDEAAVKAAP